MSSNNSNNTFCPQFGEDFYCLAIISTRRFLSILSLISVLFILFLILLLKRYLSVAHRLYIYLLLSLLAQGSSLIASVDIVHSSSVVLCGVAGGFLQFSNWLVYVSISNIAFNLSWTILLMKQTPKYIDLYYVSVNLFLPLLFTIIPTTTLSFGNAGNWCWIVDDNLGHLLRFFTLYIPLYIILAGLFVLYIILFVKLFFIVKQEKQKEPSKGKKFEANLKKDIAGLILQPLAFFLISIFPLISRVHNLVQKESPIFVIILLHAGSTPMLGILTAIVFFINRDVLRTLKWSRLKVTLLTRFNSNKEPEIYSFNCS